MKHSTCSLHMLLTFSDTVAYFLQPQYLSISLTIEIATMAGLCERVAG